MLFIFIDEEFLYKASILQFTICVRACVPFNAVFTIIYLVKQ